MSVSFFATQTSQCCDTVLKVAMAEFCHGDLPRFHLAATHSAAELVLAQHSTGAPVQL